MKKTLSALLCCTMLASPSIANAADYEGLVKDLSSMSREDLLQLRDAIDDALAAGMPVSGTPTERIEYLEGMYKVGTNLPAGTYFAIADKKSPLSSLTVKDGSGTQAKVLAVDAFTTCSLIGVNDGEYLTVRGCTLIDIAFTADYLQGSSEIPEGTYLVGYHLPAAEYAIKADEGAALSTITVFGDAGQRKVIGVDIVKGSGFATLLEGEYVKLRGCTLAR